jgi:hypothetical protein
MRYSSLRRERWLPLPGITWEQGVVPLWRGLARHLHMGKTPKIPWIILARHSRARGRRRRLLSLLDRLQSAESATDKI